jgi:tetratricopeptide (TPR) repeat protein
MSHRTVELIEQAARARREDRLVDARQDLAEAIALCRQAGSQLELVKALKALGQIERDIGSGEAARVLLEEAVGICRGQPDARQLAHTVRHLGDVHQDAGHWDLAEPCYNEALVLYRRHDQTPPLDLANAIRGIAMLKEKIGAAEESIGLWEEARGLYASAHVEAGVVECSEHLAQLRR